MTSDIAHVIKQQCLIKECRYCYMLYRYMFAYIPVYNIISIPLPKSEEDVNHLIHHLRQVSKFALNLRKHDKEILNNPQGFLISEF